MDDEKEKPQPLKFFIRGIAVPGVIILICAGIGALIALMSEPQSLKDVWSKAIVGVYVGLFFSLFGVGEIAASLLFDARRFINGIYQTLGFLTVWAIIDGSYFLFFYTPNSNHYEVFEFEHDEGNS
jgi:hypothetical protein